MRDTVCMILILLGALGAENIPFLAVMVLLAGAITFWPARSKGTYYRVCPYCGAHLDPGEPCDCHSWARPGAGTPNVTHEAAPTTKLRPLPLGVQSGHRGRAAM